MLVISMVIFESKDIPPNPAKAIATKIPSMETVLTNNWKTFESKRLYCSWTLSETLSSLLCNSSIFLSYESKTAWKSVGFVLFSSPLGRDLLRTLSNVFIVLFRRSIKVKRTLSVSAPETFFFFSSQYSLHFCSPIATVFIVSFSFASVRNFTRSFFYFSKDTADRPTIALSTKNAKSIPIGRFAQFLTKSRYALILSKNLSYKLRWNNNWIIFFIILILNAHQFRVLIKFKNIKTPEFFKYIMYNIFFII